MYSDPIADMLTRIRNAYTSNKQELSCQHSNLKENIAKVLKDNKYIADYKTRTDANKKFLDITLVYENGKAAITSIKRISKSGRRIYKPKNALPYVLSGLGIAIISTSKGVITEKEARKQSLGGEIICQIW